MKVSNRVFFINDANENIPLVLTSINKMTLPESGLPAGIRHRFTRIRSAILAEGKQVEESRVALCKEHGTLNKDTDMYEFEEAAKVGFEKALGELKEESFDIAVDGIEIDFDILDAKSAEIDVNAVNVLEEFGIVAIAGA